MSAWMFKGNPKVFDIDTYLRTTNPICWTVGAPVKNPTVESGDRIFMFRANGPTRPGGVIAVGTSLAPPRPIGEQDSEVTDLWKSPAPKPNTLAVDVQLDEVRLSRANGMLTVSALEQHPVLARLWILTARSGTTFTVTDEQDRALMELWHFKSMQRDSSIVLGNGEI
jgi:hypothetical protein